MRRNGAVVRLAEPTPSGSAGRPAGRTTSQLGSGGPAGQLGRPNHRALVRPAESAGRHDRRAEPPEPNRPSRTTAEGTTGSFRPAVIREHTWRSPGRHVFGRYEDSVIRAQLKPWTVQAVHSPLCAHILAHTTTQHSIQAP